MCYDFSSHFIFKITHFKDFRSFISASDSLIYDVYAIISIINADICFNIKYIITIYFFFHSLYSHTNTHKCALIFFPTFTDLYLISSSENSVFIIEDITHIWSTYVITCIYNLNSYPN